MKIPPALEANNQGLIGVRIRVHDPLVDNIIVPISAEHYRGLDPHELELHLSNSLLMTAFEGQLAEKHELYQLPNTPEAE